MKNVYLVIERDEGYDRISCVYSTKKKADEYVKKRNCDSWIKSKGIFYRVEQKEVY